MRTISSRLGFLGAPLLALSMLDAQAQSPAENALRSAREGLASAAEACGRMTASGSHRCLVLLDGLVGAETELASVARGATREERTQLNELRATVRSRRTELLAQLERGRNALADRFVEDARTRLGTDIDPAQARLAFKAIFLVAGLHEKDVEIVYDEPGRQFVLTKSEGISPDLLERELDRSIGRGRKWFVGLPLNDQQTLTYRR